jgi:hypothetical protein
LQKNSADKKRQAPLGGIWNFYLKNLSAWLQEAYLCPDLNFYPLKELQSHQFEKMSNLCVKPFQGAAGFPCSRSETTAGNGSIALIQIRIQRPDLVDSDVRL